ncbi:WecB/TagA/CpsF family glycosyltransferase [Arthrobacter crystallopoietes]|uniref:N-acetylglucosaminyldiphosphoundecaprenol N-acetyl-beta-D-mannosaminyltransferase n=1 Tax=Crystallibacter crystallopoietes TaxID=37928 RepID=A0A1H0ZQV5_9MICC|nr:WecB/TagA/CpsF family glycosyltransferase [Arthrobacter crystallopoietes]AUI51861.1 hypothetical protein AC20117_14750 [Arthrobacter crystallopoietes]SDQ29773.1 N-acetylglucosaminyldiphosphoundecaprenol N-acetyl-beta-D-mannosaminyltransferase [Arthrobacter crystallopoietes]
MSEQGSLLSLAHHMLDEEFLGQIESKGAYQVVTLAPWQMWLARRNPLYADSIRHCDATTIDGRWLSAILKLAGRQHDVLTGREIVEAVFQRHVQGRIAVVGSSVQSHERLSVLRPNWLCIGGSFGTEVDLEKLEEVTKRITEYGASVVFVALGSPKQEAWGRYLADRANVTVIGIGGAIETVVGLRKPPSKGIQRVGAEWLQRTIQDPVRFLPRIVQALSVMPRLVLEALTIRRSANTTEF